MVFIPSDKTSAGDGNSQADRVPGEGRTFSLAHFSDLHITCTDRIELHHLMNKRLFGYLRWKLHRGAKYQDEILTILKKDLQQMKPNHVLITGDLTHLSLPAEFEKVEKWLQSLSTPAQVTVIPGNHDAYVRTDWHQTFSGWLSYMISDTAYQTHESVNGLDDVFPILRVRGDIALIGVCTAYPCAPHLATGRMGVPQLKKLEKILKQAAAQNLFRIIAIHHPPITGMISRRKRLTDASALRRLLASYGAELVLHGHTHATAYHTLPTPAGVIPVVGVPAASSSDDTGSRGARYNVYQVSPSGDGWRISISARVYSKKDRCFVPEKNRWVSIPASADEYRCPEGS
ncbi:MAG: metallophosphoesterase [Desulfobacterales bacterium]|jgi:3',5'-cyclic AMP phosphodiesterase CpdA|nr:metallophosphoesterase [Desulfobacterales bacterium]